MSLSVPMTFVKPLTTALGPLGYLIKLNRDKDVEGMSATCFLKPLSGWEKIHKLGLLPMQKWLKHPFSKTEQQQQQL